MRIVIEAKKIETIEINEANIVNDFHRHDRFENDTYIMIVEGWHYGKKLSIEETVYTIKNGNVAQLQRCRKGEYVICLLDKTTNYIYIANDLLSKYAVYYYNKNGLITIDGSFQSLCKTLHNKSANIEISMDAIEQMCNIGRLNGNICYEKNCFCLRPYEALQVCIPDNSIEIVSAKLPEKITPTIYEAVDTIEALFRNACLLQWEINDNCRMPQIVTLSGGMDSRSVVMHMQELAGQGELINTFTYAQSGSADDTISKDIASKRGYRHKFIALDSCDFLRERNEIVDANEGQMYYAGATGAIMLARECTAVGPVGVVHTGLGGGELFGDILLADGDDSYTDNTKAMTVNQSINLSDVRGCLNFEKTTSRYFTAVSPFLDEDFFEYVMSLPIDYKLNRRIYSMWYNKYQNDPMPTTYYKGKVGRRRKSLFIRKITSKAKAVFHLKTYYDMNPFEYWYHTNRKLRRDLFEYYQQDMRDFPDGAARSAIEKYWESRTCITKLRVLTATRAICKMIK